MRRRLPALTTVLLAGALAATARAADPDPPHPVMTWVKRHPLPAATRPSPRLGYETSYGYDRDRALLVRYGGHNQGGGGEQNSEVWTYDLASDVWSHREPDDSPPGVCCAQQNVYHDALRKFLRFPAASGGHGWQSHREIYLKNSSAWAYDLDANAWRAMRPSPEVWPAYLRGAAYDPVTGLTVVHGGEGASHGTAAYDLYANAWHKLDPKGGPPNGLSQPGFAYDAVNRVFVLFGSQFASDPKTYLYDLRKNAWSVLETPEHPPADKSSPVLAADTRNGVVLCSVIGADGPETWALDVPDKKWSRLKLPEEPPKSGSRARVLLYLEDRNLFVLENNRGGDNQPREQQVWTFRYADAPPVSPSVTNVRVATAPDAATVTWDAPAGYKARYTVYRVEGDKFWSAEPRAVAKGVDGTRYVDRDVRPGTPYRYQVAATDAAGNEGAASAMTHAQPAVPMDVVASVVSPRRVELAWPKLPAEDVAGYVVERAVVSVHSSEQAARVAKRYPRGGEPSVAAVKAIGAFERLTPGPVADAAFVDDSIDLDAGMREPESPIAGRPLKGDQLAADGRPYRFGVYAYRVRAVNRLGVVGGPSPIAFTFPGAVRHVAAKEEGKSATRVRWQASPQRGVMGYLVYRHDGRYDKDPIVRVTREPIAATEFLDENAGTSARRYEVVAVDALGQEGEPSAPVWSRREYQRYYVPYVGEWHQ